MVTSLTPTSFPNLTSSPPRLTSPSFISSTFRTFRLDQRHRLTPRRKKQINDHSRIYMTTTSELKPTRLLAVGGSGRVGQQTIQALSKLLPDTPLHVTLTARSLSRARKAATQLSSQLTGMKFSAVELDIDDKDEIISDVISSNNIDIVVHMAGPFQGREGPSATNVAHAAIRNRAFYIDICDDAKCASDIKLLSEKACQNNVSCITSAGIYPGVSNLLAVRAVELLDRDDNVKDLKLLYHTAGSGGIGATVLASTFLLLSEDAIIYSAGGKRETTLPASLSQSVQFGGDVGTHTVYALRLPEVDSLHEYVAPEASISAKFSTAPRIWNMLLQAMARWTPRDLLRNRELMVKLARLSIPVVRAVDLIAGGRTAIIAEVLSERGRGVRVIAEHKILSQCVGEATAAFVKQFVLEKMDGDCRIDKGVWYPEQLRGVVRDSILEDGTRSCERLDVELF